jgi:biopolymer transport protein ExbB
MIPLLICSVIAVAVIIERAISLRRGRIIKPELVRLVQEIRDVGDVPVAFSKCQMVRGPFANLIKHVLINLHLSWEEKLHEIEVAGKEEAKTLERNLVLLEIIAGVAPLLGLLGTVMGLNNIFGVIAERGVGDPKFFSGGIYMALRTTILGLSIAIPSMVASSLFDRKVDGLVNDMERLSTILLNKLYSSKVGGEKEERVAEVRFKNVPDRGQTPLR